MAREVKGFLSATGNFYEKEEEADFHDAANALWGDLIAFFRDDRQTNDQLEAKCKLVQGFIVTNTSVVADYINAKDALEKRDVGEQSTPELQEENPVPANSSGNTGDGTRRAEPEDKDEELGDSGSTGDTGGMAKEEVGSVVQSEDDKETEDNVESNNEAKGRVAESENDGGSSSARRKSPATKGRVKSKA